MNKIGFIVPYFGIFNNFFNIFLKSCSYNSDMCDWIILTDDKTEYDYPGNVKVHYITWEEMQAYFQSKFDFKLGLDFPYKLCDFKVTYGYVFEEYLKEYEFWGHCDVDLVWGNFSLFLDDSIFNNYDKIFDLGHCTLYRNTKENNRRFFSEIDGNKRYMEVLGNKKGYAFDEEYEQSINNIYTNLNINIFCFYLIFIKILKGDKTL